MVEREQIVEAAVAVACVLTMLGAMLWIGTTFGTDGGLSQEGATYLVGAIVAFIFLLTGVGVVLAYVTNGPDGPGDATV